ncbi:MAG: glutathione S-transferase N-terminal domain-containing protein [Candidatus Algichlamydia australiensis]|nr:glutathione S-transferase N-terminal domain-containing protein [Chlamydiales bacterium]
MRKLLFLLGPLFFPPSLQADCNTPVIQVKSEQLVLYYMPTCPYCKPVLNKIREKNIPVTLKNVSADPSAKRELISKGGKGQVPCLFINGRPMYESSAILQYLDNNY